MESQPRNPEFRYNPDNFPHAVTQGRMCKDNWSCIGLSILFILVYLNLQYENNDYFTIPKYVVFQDQTSSKQIVIRLPLH